MFFLVLSIKQTSIAEESTAPINYIVKFEKRLSGEAAPDQIEIHVSGNTIKSPFKWSISIKNSGREILFEEHDDAWLNNFFGDEGYMDGCSGYIECKRKWYFSEIRNKVEASLIEQKGNVKRNNIPVWELENLQAFSQEFLKKKGISNQRIVEIVKEMKASLASGGYSSLKTPGTPVQSGTEYMYVKSLKYFVPIMVGDN
jgi:hypothetical protein